MIPFLIQTYQEFQDSMNLISGISSLYWIVEYSPQELGYSAQTIQYNNDVNRYSLLRTECLLHPTSFKERLNNHQYRIWTTVPQDYAW